MTTLTVFKDLPIQCIFVPYLLYCNNYYGTQPDTFPLPIAIYHTYTFHPPMQKHTLHVFTMLQLVTYRLVSDEQISTSLLQTISKDAMVFVVIQT